MRQTNDKSTRPLARDECSQFLKTIGRQEGRPARPGPLNTPASQEARASDIYQRALARAYLSELRDNRAA